MKSPWNLKILGLLVFLLVTIYLTFFVGTSALYIFVFVRDQLGQPLLPWRNLFGWFTVGISLALLSSLAAWPFALSLSTLLEHNKSRPLANIFLRILSYLASLPLVLFVFAYLAIIGHRGFYTIKSVWVFLFATENFFTEAIAFALTLLLYPLTGLPGAGEQPTIDLFFRRMLDGVVEFAEVGLVATVVAAGLFLFVLPKMVLCIRKLLLEDHNLRSTEIIKSLGGTPWESIHLTVMQSMKTRFNEIILYFTKLCFFEGLVTFALLNAFFFAGDSDQYHWSSSLSSVFVRQSLLPTKNLDQLLSISGFLLLTYFLFFWLRSKQGSRFERDYV